MKVKNIVKVMNFHSLIRVDVAKKKADKYIDLQNQLFMIISYIWNNKNIAIDRNIKLPNKKLTIYIGSDIGFCGSFNSQTKEDCRKNLNDDVIIIGKKIFNNNENVILKLKNEDFENNISSIVDKLILNNKIQYGKINISYYQYSGFGKMNYVDNEIFPIDIGNDMDVEKHDFSFEGDPEKIITNMFVLYIKYQVLLAYINAKGGENILRKDTTSESLKKIEEIQEEKIILERKKKKEKEFQKTMEAFVKLKK